MPSRLTKTGSGVRRQIILLVIPGVVLHSPILSGMRVLTESRALSCLDIYPNVDRASRLECPVMVVHGTKDEEVGGRARGTGHAK